MTQSGATQAGVIIFKVWRQKFFLILRDDRPDILAPNTWCPVTGGRDEGESLEETAERELVEEIGFAPEVLVMLGVSRMGNGFFFSRLTDEEKNRIILGEGQKYEFFSFEELPRERMAGAMKIYLEKFPEVFKKMAETESPPCGKDLGLATWNN